MDLVNIDPTFDLYNPEWPVLTWHFPYPPAKFVHEAGERSGRAFNSIVSGGVIVSGGTVRGSVLSPQVRINSFSKVEDSVLFENVDIGRGCQGSTSDHRQERPCSTGSRDRLRPRERPRALHRL